MNVLLALSSPDLDVRAKSLDIAVTLTSNDNVHDVVGYLHKELARTVGDSQYEKPAEYRSLLICTLRSCTIDYPQVPLSTLDAIMNWVVVEGRANTLVAADAIEFVKEMAENVPELRSSIIKKLALTLTTVRNAKISRGVLWVAGEYASSVEDIRGV